MNYIAMGKGVQKSFLCWEVVLFSEVKNELHCYGKGCAEVCPLLGGLSLSRRVLYVPLHVSIVFLSLQMMKSQDLLSEVRGWNALLSGHLRAGHIKHTYSTLRDLTTSAGLKPDLCTFKTLVGGLYGLGDRHAHVLAAYNIWREFAGEYPRLSPDLELLNQLIGCCRKCGHVERGLFFLEVMEECGLKPDLTTFRELLMVSLPTYF